MKFYEDVSINILGKVFFIVGSKLIFRLERKKSHVILLKDTFQTLNDGSLLWDVPLRSSFPHKEVDSKANVFLMKCFNLFYYNVGL